MRLKIGDYVTRRPSDGVQLPMLPEFIRLGIVKEINSSDTISSPTGVDEYYVEWGTSEPGGPFGAAWHPGYELKKIPALVALAMMGER